MSHLKKYAETGRYYHTFSHIGYMLENLQDLFHDKIAEREQTVLRFAIMYHDVVYDAALKDNEFQSALALADDLRNDMVLSSYEIREAQRLIMLTQYHRPGSTDELGKIICDLDLAGLASPRYFVNSKWIKKEYEYAAKRGRGFKQEEFDLAWIEGRKKFLSEYMNRNFLFSTELGADLWEENALKNMKIELEALNNS